MYLAKKILSNAPKYPHGQWKAETESNAEMKVISFMEVLVILAKTFFIALWEDG